MKKVLSLVLAFAMILGSFGFAFASDFADVSDTDVYGEAVNVLSGLGVIGGYPDGTFKPANVVTRAEMATMIVNALGIPVSGGAATKFSDVPASHWASGYIGYAVSVGFVAGYPDGTFKPEQQVTCNEALTMIVASLGYTLESLTGDYPGAFINKAQGLGMLDTCKKTGTVGAERSDIACYLYDTLLEIIGTVNKDGEFVANVISYDKTTEEYEYDTMLHRLGATVYNGGEPFVVTGEEDTAINLGQYLGAYITAYQNKDEEIVAVKEVKSVFIDGDYSDLKDDYKFDDAKEGKDKDGESVYTTFLNGEVTKYKDYVDEKDIKLAVKLSGKTVKEVYSMQQWIADGTFRAEADIQEEISEDQTMNGFDFALDDDDEIDVKAFILDGANSIKELKEDDIITVYLNSDKELAKIEVSDKTVVGEITKINNEGTKFTIGGTAYKKSNDTLKLALEDEGTFFLDYAGKIFDFDKDKGTSNYAIVLATGADSSRYGSETAWIKLFLADGTVKEFEVDDDVTGEISGTDWTNTFAAGSLVKYTINSKNVITELDKKVTTVAKEGEFDKNGIYNKTALSASTVVFSYNDGDKDDEDSYDVLKVADMYEAEFTGMDYFNDEGEFDAILLTGMSSGTSVYAVFVSNDAKTSDYDVWTVLYDGKVNDEMLVDKNLKASDGKAIETFTSGSAVVYKLAFGSDNEVTKATKGDKAVTATLNPDVTTTVSGSKVKNDDKSYSLDDEIAVYIYDESDDEWTAKAKSAIGGRKGAYKSITLIDSTDDGEYDIAIIVKE